ncbi:carbohydrate ABC transporter permease [Roseomonas alkaliterrae]|uniref:Multiple sugar transport system permease protein n=1 Tax=Neoroseomonas alkaliterrae TaxID=1452450 RepID=A0A840XKD9_9PROT|nr:carbohydrate ABC transporter permease [Neoroseomonas alkaliterrae]MBB5688356.1 multiple sugar transport system permease protein [Neoroseomonas alkaliterrae]MBR0676435.1 carbohydrate ABC transporter permease [Neoroseomonas alkaliterrae]
MSATAANRDLPGIYHKAGSLRAERRWAMWTAYASLIVAAVIFMAPPFYMLVTSLKTSGEIAGMAGNPWIVREPTLENYWAIIENPLFRGFMLNSIIITACVVAVTMVISILAAFALARMRFWGSQMLATGVFLTYLVPDTLLFIPLYQIVGGLGLLNSIWGLVLVYPTLTVPFCTWIMIGYFASIPKELDEAALIDGATWPQMLLKIFIPVALPGIIAATIFAFTVSWAAFVYPTAFVTTPDQMPLTIGVVSQLVRADTFAWGQIMAGALMAALPPVIIYAFLMDYYIAGLTAGATKG